jgi:hypothetical protein
MDTSNLSLTADALTFHNQEYAALRAEILQRIQALMQVEREVIVGTFLLYAWVLTKGNQRYLVPIALWLPFLLAVAGSFRLESNRHRILELGCYLNKLEDVMTMGSKLGWENSLITIRGGPYDLSSLYYGNVSVIFLMFSIFAGCALTFTVQLSEEPFDQMDIYRDKVFNAMWIVWTISIALACLLAWGKYYHPIGSPSLRCT